jgi:alanine-glyoxylate transaminase/serine-glyoxylate transaminase/serine-pyruvate transaminase
MPGRHFLQIPGPTNVPERILRAMNRPVPDHRGPELPALLTEVVTGLKRIFQTTRGEIVMFPASGTGGQEASIVNTLSSGDLVLSFNIGHFSHSYAECARSFGMQVDEVELPWGQGVPADLVHDRLIRDTAHNYKAVLIVHNETSTGVTSDVRAVREAMNAAHHPALLLVDTVSSLASIEFLFDEWSVDVAVTGTQKGLMLPPGMAVLCAGPRAIAASAQVSTPRFFFDWRPVLAEMKRGYFPFTPATLMLYGLREAIRMLLEEGLPALFARHRNLAEGVRRAVKAWNLPLLCRNPAEYSHSLTAIEIPEGIDADEILKVAQDKLNLSLGGGLGRLKGKVVRIGHLGALNELEVLATVAGTEMAMQVVGVRIDPGAGVRACEQWFMKSHGSRVGSPR